MILEFGDCLIDTGRRELRRAGELQQIEPQVYRLLLLLIEQRHRVLSRDELVAAIWAGRVVSEAAINSRIKAARAALGDDGHSQKWIRTLHRAGYRFVGEVQEQAAPLPAQAPVRAPPPGPSGDVQRIVASAETLDGLSLDLPAQASVAILPLRWTGRNPSGQLLADGLTLDVIAQVARCGWLFVVAHGSTFRFREGPYDPREIGRALGVHYVVQGRLQLSGNRMRLQVSLADARDGSEVWGETLRRGLSDLFEVQQEIAETVAGCLESRIEHREQRRALLRAPASLDAWEAYHRGCWHMYRFTPADFELAERFFQRSIELDPHSPRPWAGMSFVHWQRAFLGLAADRAAASARTMELARQSLALDPYDPLSHWAVGRAHLLYGNVPEAVEELEASVQINPSSAVGQYSLAYALMQLGEAEGSIRIVGKARRLSPFDPMTFAMFGVRGQNLSYLGRYGESATFAERAATQPNSHYHVKAVGAYCNVLAGRTEVATDLYRKVQVAHPGYTVADFLTAFRLCRPEQVELTRGAFRQLEALHVPA